MKKFLQKELQRYNFESNSQHTALNVNLLRPAKGIAKIQTLFESAKNLCFEMTEGSMPVQVNFSLIPLVDLYIRYQG